MRWWSIIPVQWLSLLSSMIHQPINWSWYTIDVWYIRWRYASLPQRYLLLLRHLSNSYGLFTTYISNGNRYIQLIDTFSLIDDMSLIAIGMLSALILPLTILAGDGADILDFQHNLAVVHANGEGGDDLFIIRSFILLDVLSWCIQYYRSCCMQSIERSLGYCCAYYGVEWSCMEWYYCWWNIG